MVPKLFITVILFVAIMLTQQTFAQVNKEPYRPSLHFTPHKGWMNDPNGMIYVNGVYHLFYQYYPDSTVWGPMHWGHATSSDMINWKEQPIALYPDSIGYIFSGSAVLDEHNTSGLGKNGKVPLVAIFTQHDMAGEKAGSTTFQTQSIAYSNDAGKSWTKYKGNPVLKNPGIKDFRDPKVIWYAEGKKWIMTLAVQDRIMFYSSKNLKQWSKESEFGKTLGAHGGVWECPDLFTLNYEGKQLWVLLVSIGSGGPNGGSATQYFIGDFNGNTFTPTDTTTKFIDYGTDNYAGVTFSNTGSRKLLLGWMSNWQYAQKVPTKNWRSAMTIARELSIQKVDGSLYLSSMPVKELQSSVKHEAVITNKAIDKTWSVALKNEAFLLNIHDEQKEDITITLSNNINEQLLIGFDKATNTYFIDRSNAGISDFNAGFAKKHTAIATSTSPTKMQLLVDASSIELFADDGLTVMTDLFFPTKPFNKITIQANGKATVKSLQYLVKNK